MKKYIYYLGIPLLAIVVFAFMYYGVNPVLIFHNQQLGLTISNSVFKEYLQIPGGITEYFSIFLFQFTTNRFLGALVYAVLIALISLQVILINNKISLKTSTLAPIYPTFFALILMLNYSFPLFFIVVILLQFLIFISLMYVVTIHNKYIRYSCVFILLVLSYYLLGGIFNLILLASFILLIAFIFRKEHYFDLLFVAILGSLLPLLLVQRTFFISIADSYFKIKPYFINYQFNYIFYAFILSLPIIVLIQRIFGAIELKRKLIVGLQLVVVVLSFSFLIIVGLQNINTKERQKLEIDYNSYYGNWTSVLELVEKYNHTDRLVQFHTNRALFHLDKLTSDMFKYNQKFGVDGLILTRYFENQILLPSTQLFLDLGYVNEAIHWGNEAVSQNENSPQIIEQLIIANIIDGKPEQAFTYINALEKFPFFKTRALYFRNIVETNKIPASWLDKRQMKPINDFIVDRQNRDSDLKFILADKPQNKMVFEYLMAYLLLNNDLKTFSKYVNIGKGFYQQKMPRVYQEAMALYSYELNMDGQDVPEFDYDDQVITEFTDFIMIFLEYNGDKKAAMPALKQKFKDTYWFYEFFVGSTVNITKN